MIQEFMVTIRNTFLAILATTFILACTTSSGGDEGRTKDTFDRSTLLANIADNIAIPALQDLEAKLTSLKNNKDAFALAANQNNLDALRASWLDAYKVWQHVEMFNIGLAEEIQFSFKMNIYPTNVKDIETNIANGSYDLSSVNNNDAVGFPALDYLLFGVADTDANILQKYDNDKYQKYLSDNVDQMLSLTQTVVNNWTSTYRETFVSQSGNTVTSALNMFTNDFIFYYEKVLRANKIGIPAGVFSTTPLPDKVEGLYSKVYSRLFVLESLQAVQNVFNGTAYNSNIAGVGFKAYLEALEANELADLINSRFNNARTVIEQLNVDFGVQINTDNSKMTDTQDALQLAVVSLKVDMLQAFNISVDFVDADGD